MSRKGIEAIYPLSPMQQGLLFHSLYTPGASVQRPDPFHDPGEPADR